MSNPTPQPAFSQDAPHQVAYLPLVLPTSPGGAATVVGGGQAGGAMMADGQPNATGTLESIAALAYQLDNEGHSAAAEALLHKAVMLEQSGQRGGAIHIPQLGNMSRPLDLNDSLSKSLAANAMLPSPTAYRINETMLELGAYTGIVDPQMASSMTLAFLQRVAQFPIIDAIIRTRQYQVTRFAKLAKHSRDCGFEIRQRDGSANTTPAAKKRIEELQDMILHGGYAKLPNGQIRVNPETGEPGVWDGNNLEKAMNFSQFMASMVRHSLTFDQACFRMEPGTDPKKYPVVFFTPVDSSMIRRVTKNYKPEIDKTLKHVKYVELDPTGMRPVCREYGWDRLANIVRNPRLDFWGRGYGLPEVEIVLDIIASMVLGLRYQREYFDSSNIPPGIVSIQGAQHGVSEQVLQSLRAQIMQAGGSVGSFWRLIYLLFPSGAGNGVSYTPLRTGVQEFAGVNQYFTALLNICCSVFTISAEEIGYRSFTGGNGAPAPNSINPGVTLEHSEDKGRKPLMDTFATALDEHLIQRIDPDFMFGWVNSEPNDLEADLDTATKYFNLGWTANRIETEMDNEIMRHPLYADWWREEADKIPEDKFPTSSAWRQAVDAKYVARAKKAGLTQWFSNAWDIPAGSAQSMFAWFQQEKMAQDQILGQAQAAAQQQQQAQAWGATGPGQDSGQSGEDGEDRFGFGSRGPNGPEEASLGNGGNGANGNGASGNGPDAAKPQRQTGAPAAPNIGGMPPSATNQQNVQHGVQKSLEKAVVSYGADGSIEITVTPDADNEVAGVSMVRQFAKAYEARALASIPAEDPADRQARERVELRGSIARIRQLHAVAEGDGEGEDVNEDAEVFLCP